MGGGKDSQIHDFHHTKQITNYGHTLFWDRICGTDKVWRNYWARKEKGLTVDDDDDALLDAGESKNNNNINKGIENVHGVKPEVSPFFVALSNGSTRKTKVGVDEEKNENKKIKRTRTNSRSNKKKNTAGRTRSGSASSTRKKSATRK